MVVSRGMAPGKRGRRPPNIDIGSADMASNAKKTKVRRNLKRHKQGKARKRILRREGSTPAFPLDPEGTPAAVADSEDGRPAN